VNAFSGLIREVITTKIFLMSIRSNFSDSWSGSLRKSAEISNANSDE
jgi:hypothetical protein